MFTLPEGQAYRFRADQYDLAFWSGAANHCQTPTCTAVTITALGFGYTATDQTIAYTYDPLNRLTSAEYNTGLYYQYTYDEVGNRMLQETAFVADPLNPPTPTVSTYSYDDSNRLTAVDGQAYTFDANGRGAQRSIPERSERGNLLNDGTYTYSYDGANRLTGVANADQTLSYSYAYTGNGDRIQQTIGGTSNNFTLDLNAGYTQVLADGASTYLYGLDRLGYSTADTMFEFLPDALGSVRQVFSVAGANEGLTLAKSYDPYGILIYSNGVESSYGFTGEQQDGSTGLVYLRARTFNPATGTFTSRDIWDGDSNSPMSYNRWAYTNGNPVNYTDPSGMKATSKKCDQNDIYCQHLYGEIPDYDGIAIVTKYKDEFTYYVDISQISYGNLFPIYIAAAIAVQSQWINGIGEIAQNTLLEKFGIDLNCSYGYAQIPQIDMDMKNKMKENPKRYKNAILTDIQHFGDPFIMRNSIRAMTQRIVNKSGDCLSDITICTKRDKLIVIGMTQNGGYDFPDGQNYKSGDPSYKIDWKRFFVKGRENGNNWRARDIGGTNFNTQFQLKLFIQNLRALNYQDGWKLPNEITPTDIEAIYQIANSTY